MLNEKDGISFFSPLNLLSEFLLLPPDPLLLLLLLDVDDPPPPPELLEEGAFGKGFL